MRKSNRKPAEAKAQPKGPLVATWVYPLAGGAGEIQQLPEGAKPPKGFAFSPVDEK